MPSIDHEIKPPLAGAHHDGAGAETVEADGLARLATLEIKAVTTNAVANASGKHILRMINSSPLELSARTGN